MNKENAIECDTNPSNLLRQRLRNMEHIVGLTEYNQRKYEYGMSNKSKENETGMRKQNMLHWVSVRRYSMDGI